MPRTERLQQLAAVIELRDGEGAVVLDGADHRAEAGNELIMKDAERIVVVPRAGGNVHRLGDDHGDAALGALGVILFVAFRREAVGGAVIGSHRPHDDAVFQSQRARSCRPLQELRLEWLPIAAVSLGRAGLRLAPDVHGNILF